MPDYKKMYLELMHATEDAIDRLIAAQQRAEDIFCETYGDGEPEETGEIVESEE